MIPSVCGLQLQLRKYTQGMSTPNRLNPNPRFRKGLGRYIGIAWHKGHRRWIAKTRVHGRYVTLGYAKNPEDAARLYDCAAIYIWGPRATINFDGLPPVGITTSEVYTSLWSRGIVGAVVS